MKKLVLEAPLQKRLNRLQNKVGELSFIGCDPNTFADKPAVAIVGTRKLSPYGIQVTRKIAEELSRTGLVVISGFAFGADITAHKAVLDAGGTTVAVVASGLDNIYPASHAGYIEKVLQKGTIISEYEAGHSPRKQDFLARNRIIAALSDAVIIPEAAERSGSLNTAKHAHEMNIPIFAVPGPITSSLSAGTNELLKAGKARVLTTATDVLAVLALEPKTTQELRKRENPSEAQFIAELANGCHDATALLQRSGLTIADFHTMTTMLEIEGVIMQDSLGNWQLA